MKTQVSILHHDYPSSYRTLVEERLDALERFNQRIVSIDARLQKHRRDHHVELVANIGKGQVLVADVQREAFGEALSEAVERMGRQLRKHHDKARLEPRRAGGAA
ncbi:MAG: ribosome-associated translation inhibitor RaiA [Planctomycetota bacterium]